MIFLSGSINIATQQELQREADLFSRNGWELKDPTTHKVSITIAQEDIDAFCDYLRSKAPDRKPKVWRDRDGVEHQAPTVTVYLNGTEMTGSWTRLRARLDPQALARQAQASAPARTAAPAPVRRAPAHLPQSSHAEPVQRPLSAAQAPAWRTNSADDDAIDEEVPF